MHKKTKFILDNHPDSYKVVSEFAYAFHMFVSFSSWKNSYAKQIRSIQVWRENISLKRLNKMTWTLQDPSKRKVKAK